MKLRLLIISLLCPLLAFAQGITCRAPQSITEGESFRVTFDIAATDIDDFTVGELPDGLEEVMPPFSSIVTQDGKSITRFTLILSAEKPGRFVLPEACATINGKTLKSKPCTLNIGSLEDMASKKGYTAPLHSSTATPEDVGKDANNRKDAKAGKAIEVRTIVSKKQAKVNEPIVITYVIRTRADIVSFNGKMPELNDFYSIEMPLPEILGNTENSAEASDYKEITWAKYVVYPQKSGKLRIPEINFHGEIKARNSSKADVFTEYLSSGNNCFRKKIQAISPAAIIDVDELPTTSKDFSGAIGKYKMRIRYADESASVSEPMRIVVSIKGDGNIKLLKSPSIKLPPSFTLHETNVRDTITFTENGVIGEAFFEYRATPNASGKFKLPTVDFTYFDTEKGEYKTLSRELPTVEVGNGKGKSHSVIAPIKMYDNADDAETFSLFLSPWYFFIIIGEFILFLIALFMGRKRLTVILFILTAALPSKAINANVERANDAYLTGNFQKAVELYKEELRKQPSAAIYYNLGNAYMQLYETGNAMLSYEHARLLNPNDEDLQNNIAIAKKRVVGKLPETGKNVVADCYRYVVNALSSNAWSVLSLFFLALALASLLACRRVASETISRHCFRIACLSASCCMLCIAFATQQMYDKTHCATAIVMQEDADVKENPEHEARNIVTIHEGEAVEITDNLLKEWKEIRLSDGRTGWIRSSYIRSL